MLIYYYGVFSFFINYATAFSKSKPQLSIKQVSTALNNGLPLPVPANYSHLAIGRIRICSEHQSTVRISIDL